MTLILAAKDSEGKVWIGADSRASNGESYFDGTRKLIHQHNYVVGVSGSMRILQIIEQHEEALHAIESDADMFRWCNALQLLLGDFGYGNNAGSSEPSHEGVWLLVATPTELYVVFDNYEFHKHDRWAIGSGWEYGMGYLDASKDDLPLSIRMSEAIVKTAGVNPTVSPDAEVVLVEGGI